MLNEVLVEITWTNATLKLIETNQNQPDPTPCIFAAEWWVVLKWEDVSMCKKSTTYTGKSAIY